MLSGYGLHAVGLELDAIAAVVIGGTSLAGGVGTLLDLRHAPLKHRSLAGDRLLFSVPMVCDQPPTRYVVHSVPSIRAVTGIIPQP